MMKNLATLIWALGTILILGNCEVFGQYAWTKDARNPVFSGGAQGSWNYEIFNPFVLFNSDSSRFEMWFIATTGVVPWNVGFATSKDGVNWTAYPSPVLSTDPGAWDRYILVAPCVIRENNQYKMWYSGFTSSTGPSYIGYATSPDGTHWTKSLGNPILGPGNAAWELGGPVQCYVMSVPGGYKMWYAAWKAADDTIRIGYSTSSDGIHWQRDTINNPVFNVGAPGHWDARAVGWPMVLFIQNTYYMWYQGQQVPETAWKTAGVATSSNGITNWTRYVGNPVFTTTSGSWDQLFAEFATVVRRGDTLHAWYDGSAGGQPRIGHATSPIVVGAVDDGKGNIPGAFMLSQNYPNPFNPSTTIRYGLPRKSQVSLIVYNTLGQMVSQLVGGEQETGYHEVRFDASGLSSGVYFYRLQAGTYVETRKLVMLR